MHMASSMEWMRGSIKITMKSYGSQVGLTHIQELCDQHACTISQLSESIRQTLDKVSEI